LGDRGDAEDRVGVDGQPLFPVAVAQAQLQQDVVPVEQRDREAWSLCALGQGREGVREAVAPTGRRVHRVRTSAASRSASPTKLKARTEMTISAPGASSQGYSLRASKLCASLSSSPHEVMGSLMPRPRNDSVLSPRM